MDNKNKGEGEMTRKEAKGNLMHAIIWNDMPKKEALDMAVEALEQKDDFESKQRIIDAITAKIDEIDDEKPDVIIGLITAIGVIKNLPDATESEG